MLHEFAFIQKFSLGQLPYPNRIDTAGSKCDRYCCLFVNNVVIKELQAIFIILVFNFFSITKAISNKCASRFALKLKENANIKTCFGDYTLF